MTDKSMQNTPKNKIKSERFVKVVEGRVNKILYSLDNLSKCSNRRNYEYSEEQVRKIFREVERKVKEVKLQFQAETKGQSKFKL